MTVVLICPSCRHASTYVDPAPNVYCGQCGASYQSATAERLPVEGMKYLGPNTNDPPRVSIEAEGIEAIGALFEQSLSRAVTRVADEKARDAIWDLATIVAEFIAGPIDTAKGDLHHDLITRIVGIKDRLEDTDGSERAMEAPLSDDQPMKDAKSL